MAAFETDEPFDLPVEFRGQEIILPCRLARRGYGYKIYVEVDGQEVIFEPDEERNFRAMTDNQNANTVSVDIVRAIGEALEKHLR